MLKEAQCAGPAVPKLIDSFSEKGVNVIIMELFEGITLKDLIKDYDFSRRHIHQISYKLLEALNHVNSSGVIHNDLKLDNVMACIKNDDCTVKIIDFGKATPVGGKPWGHNRNRVLKFSDIDPYLASHGPCSAKTDLFSLGEILLKFHR